MRQSQGLFHTTILGNLIRILQFETRSRERIAVLPDMVACNCPLRHTSSCLHRECGCMKTKDEQYQKVRLTPRVPRVVLKSNLQIGLQDQQEQDARTSCDQPSGSKLPWETGATPWNIEFLVYLFLQLNSKIHIVTTKSNS